MVEGLKIRGQPFPEDILEELRGSLLCSCMGCGSWLAMGQS